MNKKYYFKLFGLNTDFFTFYKKAHERDVILKKRYKLLMLKYHPDKNVLNKDENFNNYTKIIIEAYRYLLEYNHEIGDYYTTEETFMTTGDNVVDKIISSLRFFTETGDDDLDENIKLIGKSVYNMINK